MNIEASDLYAKFETAFLEKFDPETLKHNTFNDFTKDFFKENPDHRTEIKLIQFKAIQGSGKELKDQCKTLYSQCYKQNIMGQKGPGIENTYRKSTLPRAPSKPQVAPKPKIIKEEAQTPKRDPLHNYEEFKERFVKQFQDNPIYKYLSKTSDANHQPIRYNNLTIPYNELVICFHKDFRHIFSAKDTCITEFTLTKLSLQSTTLEEFIQAVFDACTQNSAAEVRFTRDLIDTFSANVTDDMPSIDEKTWSDFLSKQADQGNIPDISSYQKAENPTCKYENLDNPTQYMREKFESLIKDKNQHLPPQTRDSHTILNQVAPMIFETCHDIMQTRAEDPPIDPPILSPEDLQDTQTSFDKTIQKNTPVLVADQERLKNKEVPLSPKEIEQIIHDYIPLIDEIKQGISALHNFYAEHEELGELENTVFDQVLAQIHGKPLTNQPDRGRGPVDTMFRTHLVNLKKLRAMVATNLNMCLDQLDDKNLFYKEFGFEVKENTLSPLPQLSQAEQDRNKYRFCSLLERDRSGDTHSDLLRNPQIKQWYQNIMSDPDDLQDSSSRI